MTAFWNHCVITVTEDDDDTDASKNEDGQNSFEFYCYICSI